MTSTKIKIGIFSKSINTLRPYEIKIFEEIINDKNLELSVLFLDGRKKGQDNVIKRLIVLFKSRKILARIILKLQELIEKLIFKEKKSNYNSNLFKAINAINKVKLYPQQKGYFDIFSDIDYEKVKAFNLDLIIRTEFNIIRGRILDSSKYGIWSFHHGDNRVNRGGPPCFWEIIENHQNVGVTLQKLTHVLDGGEVIDRGSYNIHWSWIRTKQIVYDSSIIVLVKNLNLLKNGKFETKKSPAYNKIIYKFPKLKYVIVYLSRFYITLLNKLVKRILSFIFGIKYNHWSLVISSGDFFKSSIFNLTPIKTPKNEFWADPFLFEKNNVKYIFFENYNYKNGLGKISLGKVSGNEIVDIKDILIKDYHLSYPFIYEDENGIFMIPETSANNRLEVYRCDSFPDTCNLYSTAFEGEKIKDCNIYKDSGNNIWMFLNKKQNASDDCSDLYIYSMDSLRLNKIQPHKLNPVITDASKARNAGSIFLYKNKAYRPSQINIDGVYGRGLNINRINKLTLDEFDEELYDQYLPNKENDFIGLHHVDIKKDIFVFDICKKKI